MATLSADVLNAFVGTPTEVLSRAGRVFFGRRALTTIRSVAGGSLRRFPRP